MKRFSKENIDITNGNIKSTLIALSTPVIISMALQTAFNIIDAIFLGRLSADALAAISITFPVIFFIIAIGAGIGIGVTSLIARYIGKNQIMDARQSATHGLILSAIISIVTTALGLYYIEQIFTFMGAETAVISLAKSYMTIIIYNFIIILTVFILNSILHGEGDTLTPMKALVISVSLNIILDPILIFGYWIIPPLGIEGAAIATVISRLFGLLLILHHFIKKRAKVTPIIRGFNYLPKIIKNILKVGIPSSLSQISMSIAFFILTSFVAKFGTPAIAAFGAANKLQTIGILPSIAIATAVITIVGQNAGLKKYDRIETTVKTAIKLLTTFMIPTAIILITFRNQFMTLFTDDKTVISLGSEFLKIVPIELIFIPTGMIIASAFQGTGKGTPQLVLTMIRLFIFCIPIAYYLAFTKAMGLTGIWWSFVIAAAMTSIISLAWFKTGSWKKETKI
ncbi:MAG: hypothetical protein DRN71_00300 [Candidatus Nanohalarchaeota archaeon]|nr:MAG: hypothetical protein DRN71_00300 [Candidatus Nanohaloarchaeota archaeon]